MLPRVRSADDDSSQSWEGRARLGGATRHPAREHTTENGVLRRRPMHDPCDGRRPTGTGDCGRRRAGSVTSSVAAIADRGASSASCRSAARRRRVRRTAPEVPVSAGTRTNERRRKCRAGGGPQTDCVAFPSIVLCGDRAPAVCRRDGCPTVEGSRSPGPRWGAVASRVPGTRKLGSRGLLPRPSLMLRRRCPLSARECARTGPGFGDTPGMWLHLAPRSPPRKVVPRCR